jgi:hypothetical protein
MVCGVFGDSERVAFFCVGIACCGLILLFCLIKSMANVCVLGNGEVVLTPPLRFEMGVVKVVWRRHARWFLSSRCMSRQQSDRLVERCRVLIRWL